MDLDTSPPLPLGWAATTLGDVVETGVSQLGPQEEQFIYVDISSIDNKTKQIIDPKHLPRDQAPSRARQCLKSGDVVVSMTRPNLNAIALIPNGMAGTIGSTGFHVLRSIAALPQFLFYTVQSHDFVEAMNKLVQGALYPAVRPKDINNFGFALPPLPEQHRIVAEIERQFSLLDAGVANLKRVQANLKRYRASVLQAACTGQLVPTEAELAQAEGGRAYEPASVLLTRILAERRARWEAEQRAKKNRQSQASGHNLFSGKEEVNGLEHRTLHQSAPVSRGSSPLSSERVAQGQSAAQHLTFNKSASGLDTPEQAAGSVAAQLFRKQQGSGSSTSSPVPPESGARGPLTKGYKEPAAPDTSGLPELPEGWVWATIEQATQNHDGKRIPVKAEDRAKQRGQYPYYGASGVIDHVTGYLFDGKYLLIAEDGANLLSRSTPIAFHATGRFWVNNHAHVVQGIDGVLSSYLEIFLNGLNIQFYVTGSAQPKLTQVALNNIKLPLPPLAEQSRIVAEVERRLSVVDNLEQVVRANLKRAERLRQAVLKEAFAGRLVPQDPADEPASVLLERIKAEREAQAKTPGKSTGNRTKGPRAPTTLALPL